MIRCFLIFCIFDQEMLKLESPKSFWKFKHFDIRTNLPFLSDREYRNPADKKNHFKSSFFSSRFLNTIKKKVNSLLQASLPRKNLILSKLSILEIY